MDWVSEVFAYSPSAQFVQCEVPQSGQFVTLGTGQMRGDQHVLTLPQRMIRWKDLRVSDVQDCAESTAERRAPGGWSCCPRWKSAHPPENRRLNICAGRYNAPVDSRATRVGVNIGCSALNFWSSMAVINKSAAQRQSQGRLPH